MMILGSIGTIIEALRTMASWMTIYVYEEVPYSSCTYTQLLCMLVLLHSGSGHEGSHAPLSNLVKSYNISARNLDAILSDYFFRSNRRAEIRNLGHVDHGTMKDGLVAVVSAAYAKHGLVAAVRRMRYIPLMPNTGENMTVTMTMTMSMTATVTLQVSCLASVASHCRAWLPVSLLCA